MTKTDAQQNLPKSAPYRTTVVTLFPQAFPGTLNVSLIGKALEKGIFSLDTVNIRDFATDKHHTVDGPPAGGGAGMVLRADVGARALDAVFEKDAALHLERPCLYLSPRGTPLTQARVRTLSKGAGVTLLCGRFEGVDERLLQSRSIEEVSLGDIVLAGGEVAALALIEAIVRLLPGVMGDEESGWEESFENDLLEYPHYTKPQNFEDRDIPPVLTSGDHQKVADFRRREAEKLTKLRRPDLFARYEARKNK